MPLPSSRWSLLPGDIYSSQMVCFIMVDARSFTSDSSQPGTLPGSNMALESGKLCVKVMHCCIQCTRTCVYLHLNVSFSHIHVLFQPPLPLIFLSLSLSLSLHMHTHTHTHKYLDRCTHTSIVHDELNDILNLLLVLPSLCCHGLFLPLHGWSTVEVKAGCCYSVV